MYNKKQKPWIPFAGIINILASSTTFTCARLHSGTSAVIPGIKSDVRLFFSIQWHHIQLQVFNMASSRVPEREVREQPRRVATANLDLCVHKHSLLVIIGRTAHLRQTGHISREIERGRFPPARVAFIHNVLKTYMSIGSRRVIHCQGCYTDIIAAFFFIHPGDRRCVI